jgi:cellulose synthase/poly-beta-1,6-N-acetylglucosamine synthase-like glycosyltransferase/peptidoglycan/xylan/chitin deacetylase (PgdA/CDA1 family)
VLTYDGRRLVSHEPPPGRRIALTFDDGPNPRWTPRIARALRRLHATATFFVVGSQAARHPGIVRALRRKGFELGNHTFTHANLTALSSWQRSLQITLTENVLAGIVGTRTRLLRPPYSSVPAALTREDADALAELARRGYAIVLADFDSEDWRRPGVRSILRASTPPGRTGGIVMMHDGGGDRSQTLAALERLVPRLKARGFRFVHVSDLAGLGAEPAEVRVGLWERVRGRLLLGTLAVSRWFTGALALILLVVTILFVARVLLVVALARRHARRARRGRPDEPFAPPVSIVVPAFNEATGIERAVRSLADSDYPTFEVLVVDDGSVDGTAALVEQLGLPAVRVLRQANAGKPAALNAGIAAAAHDVFVCVDADTVFERDTLARLVDPLRKPDVGAVSGNAKVGNRRRILGRWQHIEYVIGFNLDRRLYDVLQCMPTVPGAIGAFRRPALADAGGFSGATLAEDTDVTLAIGRAGWRVVYAEDARAWTEAPTTLSTLWRQRYRWCYGTMQAVWKHRAALWRSGETRIGRRGIPYLTLFQVALPLLAPVVDVFGLYGLIFLQPLPVVTYWAGFALLQLAVGWYAFRLDGESPAALWALPLQQFVYRQLMYLVVIESVVSALTGARVHWQRIERTGEFEVAS